MRSLESMEIRQSIPTVAEVLDQQYLGL
jgi:hypothetical protein